MNFLVLIVIIVVVIFAFLSSKYSIRNRGTKTTGIVIKVSRHTSVDSYGVSHTTYYANYEFHDERGQRWTGEKRMGSSHRKQEGDRVTVYYLPKNPRRNDAEV
ncbi:MAG: DUF3592 domain-containing protein [Cyanobacteriota bacterium]|nr:DUF3592 domain-containing protein [Cyanobacteriota bacterium]